MTTLQTFADYGAAPGPEIDAPEVRHHTKRAVLDWYAAVIPGSVEAPATLMESVLADDLDRGGARLVNGRAATVRTAALINGTAAHTVEVDDIFKDAIYHPGAPTIAAALAAAHDSQANGAEFLRAVAVGYEISTRIGAALGRAHYRYWHNTGTVGTFGAASAAAALYRLPAAKFAHALATAATFASGLQQAFRMDSMSKPLHAGRAAECGVLAAQLAMAGVTGSLDVLDGEAGMGKAMSDGPDWTRAVATLGEEFNITRMTFKNHACCGHTFAPIDGVLALQAKLGAEPDQIRRITISTYGPALEVAGNPNPATAAEARFSLPFVVATAVLHGKVRLAAFSDERLRDPQLRALMRRIELNVDPQIDAAFPGQRSARVRFELDDGRIEELVQPHRRGDPELPLSDGELNEKLHELAAPVIGVASAGALRDSIWHLDSLERVP